MELGSVAGDFCPAEASVDMTHLAMEFNRLAREAVASSRILTARLTQGQAFDATIGTGACSTFPDQRNGRRAGIELLFIPPAG
jgi:hypothetical protein